MNHQARLSITEMLNSFGQKNQDYEVFLVTLGRLCEGLSDQAVIEAADRFGSGDVKDQSKTFAPSSAQFIEEARRRQEYIDLLSRPRLPAPVYRRGPLAPFEIMRQKAIEANKHLPLLFEDISFEQFKRMSAGRQIPPGAKWNACLSMIFGPEGGSI